MRLCTQPRWVAGAMSMVGLASVPLHAAQYPEKPVRQYVGFAPGGPTDLTARIIANLSFAAMGSVLPHINSGKVKALALTASERDEQLPDVPTFAEYGMSDFRFDAWVGIAMPASTSKDVIDTLARSLDTMARSESFAAQISEIGMKPVIQGSPNTFSKTIAEELSLYKGLAEAAPERIGQ